MKLWLKMCKFSLLSSLILKIKVLFPVFVSIIDISLNLVMSWFCIVSNNLCFFSSDNSE